MLEELKTIDPVRLSSEDQINYKVYRQEIEVFLDGQRFRSWEMPFNRDTAFWSDLSFSARDSFRTSEDYRCYLDVLADMPRYFNEQIVNMRQGLMRGFAQPRVTLEGRDQVIVEVADAAGEENLFYTLFKQMPAMDSCRGASPVACSGATLDCGSGGAGLSAVAGIYAGGVFA